MWPTLWLCRYDWRFEVQIDVFCWHYNYRVRPHSVCILLPLPFLCVHKISEVEERFKLFAVRGAFPCISCTLAFPCVSCTLTTADSFRSEVQINRSLHMRTVIMLLCLLCGFPVAASTVKRSLVAAGVLLLVIVCSETCVARQTAWRCIIRSWHNSTTARCVTLLQPKVEQTVQQHVSHEFIWTRRTCYYI